MRTIKYIFFHCTAAPQNQTTQEMFNYWTRVNKWKTAGYHFEIEPDGTIEQLVEIQDVANGVANYNSHAIHISYKGGIDKNGKPLDNRTGFQKDAQLMLTSRMKELFPNAIHLGHRDISLDKNGNGVLESWEWIKSCPAYDHRKWIASIPGMDSHIIPEHIVYKLHTPAIKNETVGAIQMALGIKQDMFFGVDTDKAVRAFQGANKLKVDGVVGEGTAVRLAGWLDIFNKEHQRCAELLLDIKNK